MLVDRKQLLLPKYQMFYLILDDSCVFRYIFLMCITLIHHIRSSQIRTHMSEVGVRRFQDLIGRTDLLKVRENNENPKARMLNLSLILKNALHMRPGVNIIGGSKSQVRTEEMLLFKICLEVRS